MIHPVDTWGIPVGLPPVIGVPDTQDKVTGLTDIAVIIDRSGSMEPLTDATIEGFNGFLKEQQNVAGSARLTLTLFDTEESDHWKGKRGGIETVYAGLPIQHAAPLNRQTYVTFGGTPLYDAVGQTLDALLEQRQIGEKVLVVIITDGYENSSRKFNHAKVKALIEKGKSRGWEFLFLGANIDKSVGYDMGIGNSYNYLATSDSMTKTMGTVSRGVTQSRTTNAAFDVNEADLQ